MHRMRKGDRGICHNRIMNKSLNVTLPTQGRKHFILSRARNREQGTRLLIIVQRLASTWKVFLCSWECTWSRPPNVWLKSLWWNVCCLSVGLPSKSEFPIRKTFDNILSYCGRPGAALEEKYVFLRWLCELNASTEFPVKVKMGKCWWESALLRHTRMPQPAT